MRNELYPYFFLLKEIIKIKNFNELKKVLKRITNKSSRYYLERKGDPIKMLKKSIKEIKEAL